jgi:hypothetical protein
MLAATQDVGISSPLGTVDGCFFLGSIPLLDYHDKHFLFPMFRLHNARQGHRRMPDLRQQGHCYLLCLEA